MNKLEKLVGVKHSSLLRNLVNYGQKSFIELSPVGNSIKLFSASLMLNINKLQCLTLAKKIQPSLIVIYSQSIFFIFYEWVL